MNEKECTDNDVLLKCDDVGMVFGEKVALNAVSFRVRPGEKIALLGPNGAGKSTLIETLCGLRLPTTGTVSFMGARPTSDPHHLKERVGFMLQKWTDHGEWTVEEFLTYLRSAYESATVNRCETLVQQLGLGEMMRRRLAKLSGGERRRVDVAAALMGDPDVLILDEPTAGFDVSMRRKFHGTLQSLTNEKTVIWATHDLVEAEAVCNRIILLNHGGIVADGSPSSLREKFDSGTRVSWVDAQGDYRETWTADPIPMLRELLSTPIRDLEVRRSSLEDLYLEIVKPKN